MPDRATQRELDEASNDAFASLLAQIQLAIPGMSREAMAKREQVHEAVQLYARTRVESALGYRLSRR